MDASQFTTAMRAMRGFPSTFIEEACAMAWSLSDAQRDEMIAALTQLHEKIVRNREEEESLIRQALVAVAAIRKNVQSQVRRGEESKERAEEMSAASRKLSDL